MHTDKQPRLVLHPIHITVLEFVLTPEEYALFIALPNSKAQTLVFDVTLDPEDALDYSFQWASTPQGGQFWMYVHDELENLACLGVFSDGA